VFMGEQNRRQVFGGAPKAGQALPDLARRKPRVHQHPRLRRLNISGISRRPAAQDGEFYGHKLKLVIRPPACNRFCQGFTSRFF